MSGELKNLPKLTSYSCSLVGAGQSPNLVEVERAKFYSIILTGLVFKKSGKLKQLAPDWSLQRKFWDV